MPDRFAEVHRLVDVSTAILYDTGEVVNAMPYRADTYNDPRMPLMHEIRREGLIELSWCTSPSRKCAASLALAAMTLE